MKRVIFVAVFCALAIAPAFADFSGGTFYWNGQAFDAMAQVKLTVIPEGTGGGAFAVELVSGSLAPFYTEVAPVPNLFTTFCVESNITFGPGATYWASVDRKAYSGNKPGGDIVSDVSEWIYGQWLAGNPGGYTQLAISQAIWWAEEEPTGGSKNAVAAAALLALGYAPGATPSDLGSSDHTWAMNLWDGFTQNVDGSWQAQDRQSQLIVPVPAAMLLGLLGLGAAGLKLRKFA